MTHLAITIGPIYKTIQKARSTRDIWASSFIFSLMMKEILKQLSDKKKIGYKVKKVLAPSNNGIDSAATFHGAGIYPDRCFVQLTEAFTDEEMSRFRDNVFNSLPNGLGIHKNYFHIYAVQAHFPPKTISSPLEEDNIIFQLSKTLEDAELQQKFIQSGAPDMVKQLDNAIKDLYTLGMDQTDFIRDSKKQESRLPSLIEISTHGLSQQSFYKETVTDEIWSNLRLPKKLQEEKDETILADLKKALHENEGAAFKARHKYYAIVQSDGDSVGKIITEKGNDATAIGTFSQDLMTFSKEAAKDIANFGAIPVYIGGDDLLFIAPLINAANTSIFKLIEKLSAKFEKALPSATLSFGVAIGYYKHPMSKALTTSYSQLFYGAKKLETEDNKKNALAFLVRKHSGQHFGTMLPKSGTAFSTLCEMIAKYNNIKNTFLSATMYTLQEQQYLLMNALESNRTANFFENNFNEKSHSVNDEFLKEVEKLAIDIYHDMKGVKTVDAWHQYLPKKEGSSLDESAIIANTIFSCLRLIQFLNANDHE